MLRKPTLENVQNISNTLDLRCNQDELSVYHDFMCKSVGKLNSGFQLNHELFAEKSVGQRNQGHRPLPSENPYNAWYWICNIKTNENNGSLSGKRIAIKDNIAVGGVPMMNGSKVLEGFVPRHDATLVRRILNEGGEIYGKTTCEDMCISCASYCTTYGPVKNPLDPTRITGGSSSGNAAALLAGDVEMAVGSDQGGSIRMPASCCGLVGLKPTFGLVPYTGCASMVTYLDHVGPMARNVEDCALLLEAIAGFDDCKDCRQPQFDFDVPKYSEEIKKPCQNLKVAILREGFDVCEQDVVKCIKIACNIIRNSGRFACVEEVSVPMHKEVNKIYDLVKTPGLYHQYMEGAGFGIGAYGVIDVELSEKLHQGLQARSFAFHPNVKRAALVGAYLEEHGMSSRLYAHGSTMTYHLRKAYDKVFEKFDVLLLPTTPHTAGKIQTKDNLADYLHFTGDLLDNVKSFNSTHHPALSLNAGYSEKTLLPVGLQIVGKLWNDSVVLQAAFHIENILKSVTR